MIGIYKITNKINNKCYIGQSVDISRRWNQHIKHASRPNAGCYKYPLQAAIRKYGVTNFEFEIVKLCDKSELTYWERYYYEQLKPEYNQTYPEVNPVFNPSIESRRQAIFKTEEYRLKCSKKMSDETKHKISESIKHSVKHKISHNTPEYLEKIRQIREKGKRKSKPVVMYNNDYSMTFPSLSEAARWITDNTDYKSINKVSKIKAVCDGYRHTAFGYKFSYL